MYYELLYSTKFEKLNENDEILNLQKNKKQENLNNCTFIKNMESTISKKESGATGTLQRLVELLPCCTYACVERNVCAGHECILLLTPILHVYPTEMFTYVY